MVQGVLRDLCEPRTLLLRDADHARRGGALGEALELYSEALEHSGGRSPRSSARALLEAAALEGRAECYAKMGRTFEALADLTRAIEQPSSRAALPMLLVRRAGVSTDAGELEEAVIASEKLSSLIKNLRTSPRNSQRHCRNDFSVSI